MKPRPVRAALVVCVALLASLALTATPALADDPAGMPDAWSTAEDTLLSVDAPGVLANDTGAGLNAVLDADAAHGTLDLQTDGGFSYTPDADFNGADAFTYHPTDGVVDGAAATVTITVDPVNDSPVAADDGSVTTDEDTPVSIAVLTNDTDPDADALSVASVTQPSNGSAAIDPGGQSVTYTPAPDASGPDSFTYTVSDADGGSDTATVGVTVTPVNDAPQSPDDSYSVVHDHALTAAAPGVLANDTDAEGDGLAATLAAGPANGTVELLPNGSFTYTPNAGFAGPDSFTYTASDGSLEGAVATVSITVTNVTPAANDDQYLTVPEDGTLTVDAAAGVLGNDTDADADESLTAEQATGPSHGTLSLASDGSFTYTPDEDYDQGDSFTYGAVDAAGARATATVTLAVTGSEDAPTAADDAVSTAEDTPVTIPVLANDTDPDTGDTLTVLSEDGADAEVTGADDTITYTPPPDFNGPATFGYTMQDADGETSSATVTVDVTPVNDAPTATDDARTLVRSSPIAPGSLEIDVVGNDTDPDAGNVLRVRGTYPVETTFGTLSRKPGTAGVLVYTPRASACNRTDSFTYTVADGHGRTDVGTVTVQISMVKAQPTLKLAASPRTADYLEAVSLTATLSASLPGTPITMKRRPFGGTALDVPVTRRGLTASATIHPGLRQTVTAASAGDNCYEPAVATPLVVDVRARVTGSMVHANRVVDGVRIYGSRNTPLFRGAVAPKHGGQPVQLDWQQRTGSRWVHVSGSPFRQDLFDDSTTALFLNGGSTGVLYRARLVWPGGEGNVRAASGWSLFRVSS